MPGKPPTAKSAEDALWELLRAIASRNPKQVSRLLRTRRALARRALSAGATRENATLCFLKEIGHYAYTGDTPLHIAAAAYQREFVQQLVSQGANVSAKNRRGAEPLHYAADGAPGSGWWDPHAQSAVIEWLVKAGANPDSVDKTGVTPLHRAVRTRCAAAVGALLVNGADAWRRNGSGSTPLHLAVQNTGRGGTGSIAAREEQKEIIRLLLVHGASPADKDSAGKAVEDCVKSAWIGALLRTSPTP